MAIPKVFNFDKDEVTSMLRYDMKLLKKMSKSFDYVFDKLKTAGFYSEYKKKVKLPKKEVLESGLFDEGKNYHWSALSIGNTSMLLRVFRTHITIFLRTSTEENIGATTWVANKYHGFEIYSDNDIEYDLQERGIKTDIPSGDYCEDIFYSDPFHDFNKLINPILELFSKDRGHLLWNDVALPRPKRVRIESHFSDYRFDSIDKTIYAAEELSFKHIELFAQTDMLEKIKTLEIGQVLGGKKIIDIKTDFEDDYYHDAGVLFEGDSYMRDVYSLTQYHLDKIFAS